MQQADPGGRQLAKPSPVMVHSKMLSSNTHSSVANRYKFVILWMFIEPKIFRIIDHPGLMQKARGRLPAQLPESPAPKTSLDGWRPAA